jgi:2-keto-4-pentenoate hydratase/2-oxohepta-3-ene-1,7-dioic acid hydratase in catechol pathway
MHLLMKIGRFNTMAGNEKRYQVTTSNLNYLCWSPFQQLAHHASAGCGLGTGDLLGSGTISGEVGKTLTLMAWSQS